MWKLWFPGIPVQELSLLFKKRQVSERKTRLAEPLSARDFPFPISSTFFERASEDIYSREPITCLITYPYPNENRPYTIVTVYDLKIRALLDNGSNLTIINFKSHKITPLQNLITLRTAGGDQLQIRGQVDLPFTFNGVTKIVPTLVVPNLAIRCICGMDFWAKFNIQPTVGDCALVDDSVENMLSKSSICILTTEEKQEIENIKSIFIPARQGQL